MCVGVGHVLVRSRVIGDILSLLVDTRLVGGGFVLAIDCVGPSVVVSVDGFTAENSLATGYSGDNAQEGTC